MEAQQTDARQATRDHVRGSGLLVGGRLLSMLLGVVIHVLIVRYLERADYGAFSYALAVVTFGRVAISLGHKRALARFLTIFQDRGDYDRFFGALALVAASVAGTTALLIGTFWLFRGELSTIVVTHPLAVPLLLILILLAPAQALDDIFEAIFAVFGEARAIAARKYLYTPTLRLLVVVILLVTDGGVIALALGHVAVALVGLVLYVAVLLRMLRQRDILRFLRPRRMRWSVREFYRFSLPLATGELVHVVVTTGTVVMLGIYGTADAVAGVRAVLPIALLNQVVLSQFAVLFTPVATRLFMRNDHDGLERAYWQSASWIAIMSSPVLVFTVALSEYTAPMLLGAAYGDSAVLLAAMSIGTYVNGALGMNALTLQVCGRLHYVVVANIAVGAAGVVGSALLIPAYGAVGAALAFSGALVLQNVLNQVGLWRQLGMALLPRRYWSVYATVLILVTAIWLFVAIARPGFVVAASVALLGCAVVVRINRHVLDIGEVAPELRRLPGARLLMR